MNLRLDPFAPDPSNPLRSLGLRGGRQDFGETARLSFEAEREANRANPNRIVVRPPVGAVEAMLLGRS